jgi:hypothetical protein
MMLHEIAGDENRPVNLARRAWAMRFREAKWCESERLLWSIHAPNREFRQNIYMPQ